MAGFKVSDVLCTQITTMDGEHSDGSPFTPSSRQPYHDQDHVARATGPFFPLNIPSPNGNYSPYNAMDNHDQPLQTFANSGSGGQYYPLQTANHQSDAAVGLLFPVQDQLQPSATWNMPGAFQSGDAMDLDQLPPFTVALDLYFDANTPTVYDESGNSAFVPGSQPLSVPENTYAVSDNKYAAVSPNMIEQKLALLRDGNFAVEAYNFQMAPPLRAGESTPELNELPYTFSLEFQGIPGSDIHTFASKQAADSDNAYPGYLFVNGPEDAAKQPQYTPQDSHGSNHPSVLVAGAELLPLTTTTSLTPSVLSLHLTQPSFFSAHQFIRSSFDQPPSLVHRGSIDIYNRGRLSIDSLNSGANPPSQNPRSLSSYLPFMGDRDRKLPNGQVQSDWPQQNQQLRHLIRSIFKTSSEPHAPEEEDTTFDQGFAEDLFDEDALGELADGTPLKKAKRSRRGLFNRFKTTKGSDLEAKQELGQDMSKTDTISGELVKQETHSLVPSRESASVQNSAHNSMQGSDPNSLQRLSSANLSQVDAAEPDYGALFHGVGKRRNLVGMKNKKSKADVTVKAEPRDGEVAGLGDKQAVNFQRSSQDYHSGDSRLAQSIQLSQTSSASTEGYAQDGNPSTFASASKRILGSRLLKRKASARVAELQMDVVEIDLKSLDLPPNTEILSEINPKNRTRGRKEDKAADMVDQSKIYVCGYCSRRFKRQEHLKRHFRSLHTSEKPYECSICLKKFSRTDNLNQHLKVHKQEEEAAAAAQLA